MDLTELYEEHRSFIKGCAKKVAHKYKCKNIFEDLVSAGTVAFLEQIGCYDESQGAAVATFLYPHIVGAMKREVERYFNLSRREFQKHSKDGTLLLFQSISLDRSDHDGDRSIRDFLASPGKSVEQQIYIQICLEHLRNAFETLSFKEREILGGFFGVYGHEEQTLAEVGEEFQMKENAALKAKDKALGRLRDVCMDGALGYWTSVRAVIRKASRDIGSEPLDRCPVQTLAEQVLSCLKSAAAGTLPKEDAKQRIRVLALRTVLEQLEFKAPEIAPGIFIRLARSGHDPLAAMERIAAALLEEVYYILKYNCGYSASRYGRKLRQLL